MQKCEKKSTRQQALDTFSPSPSACATVPMKWCTGGRLSSPLSLQPWKKLLPRAVWEEVNLRLSQRKSGQLRLRYFGSLRQQAAAVAARPREPLQDFIIRARRRVRLARLPVPLLWPLPRTLPRSGLELHQPGMAEAGRPQSQAADEACVLTGD